MLLRSITKNVKDQNWFAVFLDFIIVVVGILMAFQISNWNAARQEQASQKLMHQRLLQDFEIIEQQNDRAVEYIENQMDALIVLQKAVARGNVEEGEDEPIKYALESWFSYPSFNQRSGTYTELLSSGRLDLIENESLRVALSKYDLGVLQSKYNETRIHEFLIQNIGSIEFAQYRTMAPPARNDVGEIARGEITHFDIGAMDADPVFRSLLDQVIENRTWLIGNVYGQRRNLRAVRDLLEETQ